jgi:hypothetical protein
MRLTRTVATIGLLFAGFSIEATAAATRVASAPVGVVCEIKILPVTKTWGNPKAVEKEFADDAIHILRGDPLYDYWEFVAEPRTARIHILLEEGSRNLVTAQVTIRVGDAIADALEPVTLLTPQQIDTMGWPTKDELKAFLRRQILSVVNRQTLWPKLKNRVAIGEQGGWSAKPFEFAVPVLWNDRFKTYWSLIRAGTESDVAGVVYGVSLRRSAAAQNGKKTILVLAARAQCISMDNEVKVADAVPNLGTFTLRPVYVHKVADTPLQPIYIECTPAALELQ